MRMRRRTCSVRFQNKTKKTNFSLRPEVSQNIATHTLPSARNFFLDLTSTFTVHSSSFSPNPLPALAKTNVHLVISLVTMSM